MSAPEAARLLGVKLHTVHRMIDRGELAAEVVPLDQVRRRRAIRVRRQDVDDFIEHARVKPGDLRHLHENWTWERYGQAERSSLPRHTHTGEDPGLLSVDEPAS